MILCVGAFVVVVIFYGLERNHLTKSKKQILIVLLLASALGAVAGIMEGQEKEETDVLPRNVAGTGAYEEELQLNAGDVLKDYDYKLTVPEQIRTKQEEQVLLEQAKQEIAETFLGENTSFDTVNKQVIMGSSYQNGAVAATWEVSPYMVLDENGQITEHDIPKEGKLVQLSVELVCGETACCYEFPIRIVPVRLSVAEQILKEIGDNLETQEKQKGTEEIRLPESIGSVKLQWSRKKDYTPEKVLALGVVCAGMLPLIERSKQQKERKKREQMLLMEYPDLISKLVLLMGSGMNLSGAWKKIATDYENKRKKKKIPQRISGEEMLLTCHEMERGIGEGVAYERFGERCQISGYRKLGNTLSRNLQKGNQGLSELLETQVDEAFEERKNVARKYGEEAGTKLLFPMILMLAMIMVVLLIPALLSFQL